MSTSQQLPEIRQHTPFTRFVLEHANSPLCSLLRLVAPLLWRNPQPRSRVLVLCKNHILLVRNLGSTGKWTLPGGGAKMHESFAQAALREAREELSIVIPADSLLELGHYTKPAIHTRFDKICFAFIFSQSSCPIRLSYEIIEARWCPVAQLPRNTSPVVACALRDYTTKYSMPRQ